MASNESVETMPASQVLDYPEKLSGYEFWRKTLKSSRLVVAPMVDQSELAWRLLSRRYGAELCYTPMLHASMFVKDARYRKENLVTTPEDRPLIAQFCANDPDTLLKAAKLAEGSCDAIDLNLGCPQSIAKRGHYGAFLQDEWDLVSKMVRMCHQHLKVPITCKMRILESVERTVQYAKTLEAAGCQLLTVHGRTRDQKGINTGLANWAMITAIRDALKIPVYANGNIQYLRDVENCMKETGVDGVMSAEGNLYNPGLFTGGSYAAWAIAEEYVDLYEQYRCPLSFIRGHLFKIFHHCLQVHLDLRPLLARAKVIPEFREFIRLIKEAAMEDLARHEEDQSVDKSTRPYWICQPYVRPKSNDPAQKLLRESRKRPLEIPGVIRNNDEPLSQNKLKRMQRNPYKSFESNGRKYEQCDQCGNPKGIRCEFNLCKACCRPRCNKQQADCPGHRLWFNRERRLTYEAEEKAKQAQTMQNSNDGSTSPEGPAATKGSDADSSVNGNAESETTQKVAPVEGDADTTADKVVCDSRTPGAISTETNVKVTDIIPAVPELEKVTIDS